MRFIASSPASADRQAIEMVPSSSMSIVVPVSRVSAW
jgi:hypothetical protein